MDLTMTGWAVISKRYISWYKLPFSAAFFVIFHRRDSVESSSYPGRVITQFKSIYPLEDRLPHIGVFYF